MKKYKRIRGLLLIPTLGLFISPFVMISNIYDWIRMSMDGTFLSLVSQSSPHYHFLTLPIFAFEIFLNVFLLIGLIYILRQFMLRKKTLPMLVVFFYVANFILILVDTLVAANIQWLQEAYAGDMDFYKDLIRATLTIFIWVPYFILSDRVKGTFINGKKLSKRFYVNAGIGAAVVLLFFVVFSFFSYFTTSGNEVIYTDVTKSSVVNIYCPYGDEEFKIDGERMEGGSGVVMTPLGEIVTNAHIFPQNDEEYLIHDEGCFVYFPDPKTGVNKDIYLAHPVLHYGWSDNYDLAYLQIYDVYRDEEKVHGDFPKRFLNIGDVFACGMEDLELGDPVTVLGYPDLGGGLNLTITEGLVSGIYTEEKFFMTDASVSNGNSGGLALSKGGCFAGIPSFYVSDEGGVLTGVYSYDYLIEFAEALGEEFDPDKFYEDL